MKFAPRDGSSRAFSSTNRAVCTIKDNADDISAADWHNASSLLSLRRERAHLVAFWYCMIDRDQLAVAICH